MVNQLITHERIRTTLPKAKELRRVADQVVTLAKQGDVPARKRAEAILRTPEAVDKLFDVFAPRYEYVQALSITPPYCGPWCSLCMFYFVCEQSSPRRLHAYLKSRFPTGRRRRDGRHRIHRPVSPPHMLLLSSHSAYNNAMLTHVFNIIDRPGEMRKAKPPQGIAAINAAFEAQAAE